MDQIPQIQWRTWSPDGSSKLRPFPHAPQAIFVPGILHSLLWQFEPIAEGHNDTSLVYSFLARGLRYLTFLQRGRCAICEIQAQSMTFRSNESP